MSRRAGRPPIDPTGAAVSMTCRVPGQQYDALTQLAQRHQVTVADLTRLALRRLLKAADLPRQVKP